MTERPRGERLRGLPGLLRPNTRILVLGSFPSEASLAAQQYYGHPRNQFWRLLGACLGEPLAELPYEERLPRVAAQGVGIWDVVGACQREGSLDSAIVDAEVNALAGILRESTPLLRRIGFNGGLAWKLGRHLAKEGYEIHRLPSSSPAAALYSFEEKLKRWRPLFAE